MVEDSLPNGFNRDFNKLQRLSARNMPTAGDINKQIAGAKKMANILSDPESAKNYFNVGLKSIEQMEKSAKAMKNSDANSLSAKYAESFRRFSARANSGKGYPTYSKHFVDNILKYAKQNRSKGYPYNKRTIDNMLKHANRMNHETIGDILGANWKNNIQKFNSGNFSAKDISKNFEKLQRASAKNNYASKDFKPSFSSELDRIIKLQNEHGLQLVSENDNVIDDESIDILSDCSDTTDTVSVSDKDIADLITNNDNETLNDNIKYLYGIAIDAKNSLHFAAQKTLYFIFCVFIAGGIMDGLKAPLAEFIEYEAKKTTYYELRSKGLMATRAYIDVTSAPIRSGHSMKASIEMELPVQTELKVIKYVGKWALVKVKFGYNYESGWIQTRYLNIND